MKSPLSSPRMPFIGMFLMLRHLRGDVTLHSLDRVRDYVIACLLGSIAGDVFLSSESAGYIDGETFFDHVKRRDSFVPFPCRHIMPGGLDHRLPVAVFVGEIGGYGKMSYPRVSDLENVDVAYIPPDFNSVQLFHNPVFIG